jgi:hypothetical protein
MSSLTKQVHDVTHRCPAKVSFTCLPAWSICKKSRPDQRHITFMSSLHSRLILIFFLRVLCWKLLDRFCYHLIGSLLLWRLGTCSYLSCKTARRVNWSVSPIWDQLRTSVFHPQTVIVWVVTPCSLVSRYIPKKHAASVVRVEMCRMRNWPVTRSLRSTSYETSLSQLRRWQPKISTAMITFKT